LHVSTGARQRCHLSLECDHLRQHYCRQRLTWPDSLITDGYRVLPSLWLDQMLRVFPGTCDEMPVAIVGTANPLDDAVMHEIIRRGGIEW
jgi:hypothetical protein